MVDLMVEGLKSDDVIESICTEVITIAKMQSKHSLLLDQGHAYNYLNYFKNR